MGPGEQVLAWKIGVEGEEKQGRVGGRGEGLGELWELLSEPQQHQQQAGMWESPLGQLLLPCWDPREVTKSQELLQKRRIFFFTW